MVDVSSKRETLRLAEARAVVTLGKRAYGALAGNAKGDALGVARLAGIQAAKKTSDLIPLCHPLIFDAVDVSLALTPASFSVEIRTSVRGTSSRWPWVPA